MMPRCDVALVTDRRLLLIAYSGDWRGGGAIRVAENIWNMPYAVTPDYSVSRQP